MDQIAHEYALKAVNIRIKKLNEFIGWQDNIIKSSTKKKEVIGEGVTASTIIKDKSTTETLLEKALRRKEDAEQHLEKYEHAKEELLKTPAQGLDDYPSI